MGAEDRFCFVVAPIGEEGSEVRKRSDQVLRHIIRPAAEVCGYKAVRADEIPEPGIVTGQVIKHVMEDPMAVADLTGRNPNVFYELAVRHILKKPLVQIIQLGEPIPFDVAATRVVRYNLHDPDSIVAAKEEIIKHMRAVEKDPKQVDNPISAAIDIESLKQSGNPIEAQLANLSALVLEVRGGIEALSSRLSTELRRVKHQTVLGTSAFPLSATGKPVIVDEIITPPGSGRPVRLLSVALEREAEKSVLDERPEDRHRTDSEPRG